MLTLFLRYAVVINTIWLRGAHQALRLTEFGLRRGGASLGQSLKGKTMQGFQRSRRGMKSLHLLGAAAIALSTVATTAAAQDDDVITVTGTRIADANAVSPVPVTTVDSEEIGFSGQQNLADILRTVPAFGVSGLTLTNSNFSVANAGLSTLDLRNLGEDRTLIVMNGRRMVAGLPGTNVVDINQIPAALIERVEVITGGASAVYGSDALAGVVNFVLKDDYEGVEVTGQYGLSEEGDDEEYTTSITVGGNFADGKGNAVFSTSFTKNNGILSANRSNTAIDDLAACYLTGDPADCDEEAEPFTSSFPPAGRFVIEDDTTATSYNSEGDPFAFGSLSDGFNRQSFRTISIPIERFNTSTFVRYEVAPNVELFAEGLYSSSETSTQLEPFPLESGDLFGGTGTSTGVPLYIDSIDNGVTTQVQNPIIPDSIAQLAIDAGDDSIGFTRRTVELGARGNDSMRQTYRLVGGLRGTIQEAFDWEVSYNFGRTTSSEYSDAQPAVFAFREALDTEIVDGTLQCADAIARAEGCVPVDVFGEGSISQEAADYIGVITTQSAEIRQETIQALINGPLEQLTFVEGAPVSFAAGFEYRQERSEEIYDGLRENGFIPGNNILREIGSFSVWEMFGEVNVPLVADKPFVEELTVGAAYRYSEYNIQDATDAYSFKGSWKPHDKVRIRGQYARAVRAPNVSELFNGGGETFGSVSDPCNGIGTANAPDQTTINNCLADPLVAARVDQAGEFVLTQAELQGTGGFTGQGNPDLDNETGISYNVGGQYDDDFGVWGTFRLSVDYFNIKIEDLITAPGRQFSLDECYEEGNQEFCSRIVRDPNGPVTTQGELLEVNTPVSNAEELKTSGIDVAFNHDIDLTNFAALTSLAAKLRMPDAGFISTRGAYQHLLTYESTIFGGFTDSAGVLGLFDHEFQGGFRYMTGPFTFSWETTYLSSAPVSADGFFSDVIVDAYVLNDMQMTYDLQDGKYSLFFGIDNVLDAEAPAILTGIPGNATGTDTAPDIYDVVGRAYYTGLRARF